jgi:tetrahydromethanopterin S-methyltransferase subunit G
MMRLIVRRISILWKKPLKSFSRWIEKPWRERIAELDRQLEIRAQIATAEACSYLDKRLDEVSRKIEADAVHAGERLSDVSRKIEVSAMAIAAQARMHALHASETRGYLATREAKAYADQGLFALSRSMRAAHRIVLKSAKQLEGVDRLQDQIHGLESLVDEKLGRLKTAVDQKLDANNWPAEVNAALHNLERDLSGFVQNYNEQLRNAEKRIEFVRSETMYEMQVSLAKANSLPHQEMNETKTAKIINQDKLAAMRRSGLRINIGCGHIQPKGFVNVDGRELPGIDIIADATNIPLEDGEVEEIFSSHLVEHFTSHILERLLLPYWLNLLKSGGTLTTVAPDGEAMLRAVNDGNMTFDDFREVLFGGQDYDGDFHYNLITPDSFTDVLTRAGFVDIDRIYTGERNGKCFEFKITARKR